MYQDQTQDYLHDIQNRINLQKCQYDHNEHSTSESADEDEDIFDQACGFCQGCIEGVKETGIPNCHDVDDNATNKINKEYEVTK